MLPILLSLCAAITWGAGDFWGGIATKKTNAYGVVIVSHLGSLIVMVVVALLAGESLPDTRSTLFGIAAGITSGTGLMLLYRALSEGKMSIGAPVSAVVAAAIPVFTGALLQGMPGFITLMGFVLAFAAVWLVTSEEGTTRANLEDLWLPFQAGIAFGLFFVLMNLASKDGVYWPIVTARVGSVTWLMAYSMVTRKSWIPARERWLALVMIGVIDVTGTVFYVIATQIGRLDVTAVIGSLYPGATVILAWIILKEKISRLQLIGVLLALGAIILLTL